MIVKSARVVDGVHATLYWRGRLRGMVAICLRTLARSVGVALAVGLVLPGVSAARGVFWSVQPTPLISAAEGVSCVSASVCIAVGGAVQPGPGTMRWDGKRWRLEATPNPDPVRAKGLRGNDFFDGVSCASSRFCVAAGGYATKIYSPDGVHYVPVDRPLAERWNGVKWSLLPFPRVPTGGRSGYLGAVSCTSSSACVAVGRFYVGNDPELDERLLAERWNGRTWSVQSMPAPAGVADPSITAFSCSSSKFCIAVGSSDFGVGSQMFAERWDGSSWSPQPAPQIADKGDTQLSSVSCTSSTSCIAVEEYFGPSEPLQTLVERWNGTNWTIQSTPNALGGTNLLVGVSCTSGRACTAVGWTDVNSDFAPLVARWDGARWSLERTPNAHGASLQAVSCTSSVICTAIGSTSCAYEGCPGAGDLVALQSVPAGAKLSGMPASCASGRFTAQVTGSGIFSVAWSVDSKRLKGHTVARGTRYLASVLLSPGRHVLDVKVHFERSSQTPALALHRIVRGCTPAH